MLTFYSRIKHFELSHEVCEQRYDEICTKCLDIRDAADTFTRSDMITAEVSGFRAHGSCCRVQTPWASFYAFGVHFCSMLHSRQRSSGLCTHWELLLSSSAFSSSMKAGTKPLYSQCWMRTVYDSEVEHAWSPRCVPDRPTCACRVAFFHGMHVFPSNLLPRIPHGLHSTCISFPIPGDSIAPESFGLDVGTVVFRTWLPRHGFNGSQVIWGFDSFFSNNLLNSAQSVDFTIHLYIYIDVYRFCVCMNPPNILQLNGAGSVIFVCLREVGSVAARQQPSLATPRTWSAQGGEKHRSSDRLRPSSSHALLILFESIGCTMFLTYSVHFNRFCDRSYLVRSVVYSDKIGVTCAT